MIKPCGDRVLIQKEKAIEKTASGLILVEEIKKSILKGKVIEVGESTTIKKGTMVYFQEFSFDEMDIDGKKYFVGKEELLLAKEV